LLKPSRLQLLTHAWAETAPQSISPQPRKPAVTMAAVIDANTAWSPQMTYYLIQTVVGLGTIAASFWLPGLLIGAFVLSVLLPILSSGLDLFIWDMEPRSDEWIAKVFKWFAVTFLASLPALLIRVLPVGKRALQAFGVYTCIVVLINMLWTLYYSDTWIDKVNGAGAVLLCISRALQMYIAYSRADAFAEKSENGLIVYVAAISMPYVVCYMVWNTIFSAMEFGFLGALHIFMCIVGMLAAHRAGGCQRPIEHTFSYARSTTLGTYTCLYSLCGMIDYFRDSPMDPAPPDQTLFLLYAAYTNLLAVCFVVAGNIRDACKLWRS